MISSARRNRNRNRNRTTAPAARERQRIVLTVSDLTANIRGVLENAYSEVWVEAEISNCRLWNTGHLYFTLKDPGAQIKAVMFKSDVRSLKFKPEDGLHVIVRGRISVYEPKGEYQIVCERMEPHGLGALQLAFDQLKRRLQAEGLFDAARKRALPSLPRKIGIVTSLDGAAIRDIIKVLGRRYPNAHLVIRPARVQGEGAAADVARGIRDIVKVAGIDVVIVGRGGGSIEDLWAFNEEVVARAIVGFAGSDHLGRRPRSRRHDRRLRRRRARPDAIGRGGDRRRAQGRFLQPHRAAQRPAHGRRARIGRAPRIARASAESQAGIRRLVGAPRAARAALRRNHARLAARRARVGQPPAARVPDASAAARAVRLAPASRRRARAPRRRRRRRCARRRCSGIMRAEARLQNCAARLDSLSPLAVLGRGYAVVWDESRTRVIRRASEVKPGDGVRVTLSEGELTCEVVKTDGLDN